MVVQDVVGRHRRRADERMSRTRRDPHPEVADHLHRQVPRVNGFRRHGDLTSTQDPVPLLGDDLRAMMESKLITLLGK